MFFSPAWRTHKGPAQMDGAAVVEVFTVESYSRLSSYTRELFCEKIKTHGFFFFSPLKDFFFFFAFRRSGKPLQSCRDVYARDTPVNDADGVSP